MKFSVPTNFDDNLILTMDKKEVYEVYGKLPLDFIGGNMAAYILPSVNKKRLFRHIDCVHKADLKFNYVLNPVCLGNREWTISGQKKMHRLLGWLTDIGIDSVTVAVPYLLQFIKKYYAVLKVKASVVANINNIAKAKYWEELGADLINLDCCGTCRDFDLLAKIRKNVNCELQLVANDACLYWCYLRQYHFEINAHASQSGEESKGSAIDYCVLSCRYLRLLNPVNFIRGIWIRPEDIHYYEEIGINSFKFVPRSASTEDISRVVSAYTARYYNGNLMDLLLTLTQKSYYKSLDKLSRGLKYFFRPFRFNLFIIYELSKLLTRLDIYIDNRSLDGFLEHFVKGNCKDGACLDCGYCQRTAERVVKMNKDYRDKAILKYKEAIDMLLSKRMSNFI